MVDAGYTQRKFITLNDGTKMPRNGFGTWESPATRDLDNFVNLLKEGIKSGLIRHIDTASCYGNEEHVGKALKEVLSEGTVKREDLYITTKIWTDEVYDVEKALKGSLAKLQLDYVDLYLVHWPFGEADSTTGKIKKQVPLHVTWKAMEAQVKAGRTKSIGVSNFNVQVILDLLSYAEIKPVCNQIEVTPYLTQEDLVKFCKKNDIEVVAYSPLGQHLLKNMIQEPAIQELSKKYNKTPVQVILNWHLSRGYTIIPKTANLGRLKENLESDTFELSPEDAQKVSNLNKNLRRCDQNELDFLGGIPLFA